MKLGLIALLTILVLNTHSATITFSCNYKNYADSEGLHRSKSKFELKFLIDLKSKKGYMIGNLGSEEITIIENSNSSGISFIEITQTKNVMITTIDQKMNSVHSRHTILSGELVESQYYGSCKKQ